MGYANFEDLLITMVSNKVLHNKSFRIDSNSKYDRYQHGLASMV